MASRFFRASFSYFFFYPHPSDKKKGTPHPSEARRRADSRTKKKMVATDGDDACRIDRCIECGTMDDSARPFFRVSLSIFYGAFHKMASVCEACFGNGFHETPHAWTTILDIEAKIAMVGSRKRTVHHQVEACANCNVSARGLEGIELFDAVGCRGVPREGTLQWVNEALRNL